MEYLVTMTTHVPEGTPEQPVEDVRAVSATPLSRHPSDPASQA
jgi:muconolactone delta-isomerase